MTPLILWLVFRGTDWKATAEALRSVRPDLLAVLVAAAFLQQVVMAWRWEVLLRRNGLAAGFGEVLRMHCVSLLFQSFLPSGFGGDAARFAQVMRKGRRTEGLNSVLVARMAGFFVLALFVLGGSFFVEESIGRPARWWSLVFLGGGVALWLAVRRLLPRMDWERMFGEKAGRRVSRFLANLRGNLELRGLAPLLAISVLLQAVTLLPYQVLFWAMGLPVSPGKVLTAFPVVMLLVTVVPSVNGIGAREFFLWRFFAAEFGDRSVMAAFSIVLYAAFVATLLPGVVFWLFPPRSQGSTTVHPSPPDSGGADA